MSIKVKGMIFKLGLTLMLLAVIMLFITDRGTPERYVCIITAAVDFVFCIGLLINIRLSAKKNKKE